MKIDKDTIINLLRSRGDSDKADQAERELPNEVDHDKHSGLLDKFGIDPGELLGKLKGGGLSGLLGGDKNK